VSGEGLGRQNPAASLLRQAVSLATGLPHAQVEPIAGLRAALRCSTHDCRSARLCKHRGRNCS
ncbi:MAG: hypothetical protein ACK56F_05385, partial [bacterium]